MRTAVFPILNRSYALTALTLLGVHAGCSSDSHHSLDAGTDAAVVETDSGATHMDAAQTHADASTAADDAGESADAGTCALHLKAGFTNVAGSATASDFGRSLSMTLDENDDPMFAYLVFGDDATTLNFVHWDSCTGKFTDPVSVDTVGGISNSHGVRQVAIAYDASNGTVGVAYQKVISQTGMNDGVTVWLATRKKSDTTFTTQRLSEGDVSQSAGSPALAMHDGKVYAAYAQSNYDCGGTGGGCSAVWLLESGGADADAGTAGDGGTADSAFSHTAIRYAGDVAQARLGSVSMALDSASKPGLAFYVDPETGYTTSLLFWRDGLAEAVLVTDTNDIQNDSVDVSLAFEGTKPRVAGHLVADSSANYDLTFVASDDGSTWSAPVRLPEDGNNGTAFTSALAVDESGNVAVAADTNSGAGDNVCNNPYLARSTDGVTFSACGADSAKAHKYSVDALNAAFGSSRIKGKLVLAFQNSSDEVDTLGIVYWQDQ